MRLPPLPWVAAPPTLQASSPPIAELFGSHLSDDLLGWAARQMETMFTPGKKSCVIASVTARMHSAAVRHCIRYLLQYGTKTGAWRVGSDYSPRGRTPGCADPGLHSSLGACRTLSHASCRHACALMPVVASRRRGGSVPVRGVAEGAGAVVERACGAGWRRWRQGASGRLSRGGRRGRRRRHVAASGSRPGGVWGPGLGWQPRLVPGLGCRCNCDNRVA
mgnify:CR=1 FL=1